MIIPIVSAILYRCGGTDQWKWCPINQKLWRWLGISLWVGIAVAIMHKSWVPLLAIGTYIGAFQGFPYGEKSWLNFLGAYGKFFVCGMAYGASSFLLMPWGFALLQTLFSAFAFMAIKYFDDKGKLVNPWTELARGFVGTLFIW